MTKEDEAGIQSTAEVVELLEEEHITMEVVGWVAGDEEPPPKKREWLDQLQKERGDNFYSDLLFTLLGQRYPQSKSHSMWNTVVSHRNNLIKTLGRNPGIAVAALDWLTNFQDTNSMEFTLIESSNLENMLERAVVDGLTELYDHDTFITLLEKEIERAKRFSENLVLMMLDLDDFKQINDSLGHLKGDESLAGVADTIRKTIRSMDIAGRYGGEEFAVILPESDIRKAIQTAQRLCNNVEARFINDTELTISIGVACFPEHGNDSESLIRSADEALYQAKAEGKNRVIAKKN